MRQPRTVLDDAVGVPVEAVLFLDDVVDALVELVVDTFTGHAKRSCRRTISPTVGATPQNDHHVAVASFRVGSHAAYVHNGHRVASAPHRERAANSIRDIMFYGY